MKKLFMVILLASLFINHLSVLGQTVTPTPPTKILVKVKNDFDKPIKVRIGEGRITYVEPGKVAALGNVKPGKHTFTIFNEKEEIVDTVTRNVGPNSKGEDKFFLNINKDIISNEDMIDGGLSTGAKVAIGAGAIGAAALVASAIKNKNESNSLPPTGNVVPPSVGNTIAVQPTPVSVPVGNNAFASGGLPVKFLNAKYDQVTLIIEGTDGMNIGANWLIVKDKSILASSKHVLYNGQKVTIGPNQKVSVQIPGNFTITRYGFELDKDPLDGSYVWVLK